ncbi:MAG: energy-coupling factor transporter transmembrane component T [Clostridia bacterium]|nr:energy-coupling factor transporter transmembrane component T [Clostridia bacterium]
MFRDVTLGQYYPADSFVHRMDARVKLVLSTFYLISIFYVQSFVGFGLVTLFLLTTIAFSRVPLRSVLRSIKGIAVLIIFMCILNIFFFDGGELLVDWWIIKIYLNGILSALRLMLRLVLLVLGTSLLTLTTTPVDLTHGIESLCTPLKWIKFPVHELALIMSLALSFIPTLIGETDRIIKAQKARCASFDTGGLIARAKAFVPILIPLLVSSFRRADELALAMNSRCYEGATHRTQMRLMKLSIRDAIGTLVVILFFTAVFLTRSDSIIAQHLPLWIKF